MRQYSYTCNSTSGDLVGCSGQFGTVVAAAFLATAGEDVWSESTSSSRDCAVLSGTPGPSRALASDSLGECVLVFVTRLCYSLHSMASCVWFVRYSLCLSIASGHLRMQQTEVTKKNFCEG